MRPYKKTLWGRDWTVGLDSLGFDLWFELSFGRGEFTLIVWKFIVWVTL